MSQYHILDIKKTRWFSVLDISQKLYEVIENSQRNKTAPNLKSSCVYQVMKEAYMQDE